MFLSADTGGGHRASAESLAKQFLLRYPGSTYELLDVWSPSGIYPYKSIVNLYKHLSANPRQWRLLYHVSNSLPWEILTDLHTSTVCERGIRRLIDQHNPDVVVSVHPAMNYVPLISTRKISKQKGKHIPFFTVVTDLGSAHTTWFQKKVDKLFVASERLFRLARRRGRTPKDKIAMTGLPIRHDFAVQAHQLGDRTTPEGRAYQAHVRAQILGLPTDHPVILIMGGGEGVGSLSDIVDEVYASFAQKGIDVTVCVVCGRNEKLKKELEEKDWNQVVKTLTMEGRQKRMKRFHDRRSHHNRLDPIVPAEKQGKVNVVALGFLTNIAEYMVAADILVSKAGPGTIAEAAAVGLPVLMTSFLPGQEAGNVDFVEEKGFGDYCDDPVLIADEISGWLQDSEKMKKMSLNAQSAGHPDAAAEIVEDIGSMTHTWKALNGDSQ